MCEIRFFMKGIYKGMHMGKTGSRQNVVRPDK